MDLPPCPMTVTSRVAFDQTDAAGLMHFSTYFHFMEAAEAALFRSLGHPLLWNEGPLARGFPRVDCSCRFRLPVYFDEEVRTCLKIDSILDGRIRYTFVFYREDERRCATGHMTTICAMREQNQSLQATAMPEKLLSALESWKSQAP